MHLPFQHRALPSDHRRRRERSPMKVLVLIPASHFVGPPAPAELNPISPPLS